jgi:hypothetical protein
LVTGGTLDLSGFAQNIGTLSMSSLGTLNIGFGNLIQSAGTDTFAGTLNISGSNIHTGTLMTYLGHTGAFTINGLPNAYQLLYGATELDIVSAGAPVWQAAAGGSWTNGANWTTGTPPNAIGAAATFGTGTGDAQSITLDSPQTLGSLTFTNTASTSTGYSLDAGTAGTLTLDNSGAASIVVTRGSHAITTPVYLVGGNLTVSASNGGMLAVSGNISQDATRNFTLQGDGTGELILSGSNSLCAGGGTATVSAGTLALDNSTALADGTNLTLGDGTFFASAIQPAGHPSDGSAAGSSINVPLGSSLAPVPEPGTLAIAAAVAGIAVARRRWVRRQFSRRQRRTP